jgi:pimeloyl-ACP methyl ester carboxylesterase
LTEYHHLVPDLPGYSGSRDGVDAADISIEGTARQVADIIRTRATNGRAVVVGLSLGGYIGLQLLADAPEVVERLIITGVSVFPYPNMWLMKLMIRFSLPSLRKDETIAKTAARMGVPASLYRYFADDMRNLNAEVYMRWIEVCNAFRQPHGLMQNTAPLLVVAPEKDRVQVSRSARALMAKVPNTTAVIALRVGHNWSGENPALFNAMIRAWITGAALPAELQPLA